MQPRSLFVLFILLSFFGSEHLKKKAARKIKMVCVKLLVVDVDEILKNNGDILKEIKKKYPNIAQLFHFRKSHHVHFVGPSTTQIDIVDAANDVYQIAGEPFSFSAEMAAQFISLIEQVSIDKVANLLADTFRDGEKLARDDKTRIAWRVPGPMYGVCAHSPERRRALMEVCVERLNSTFGISLKLMSESYRVKVGTPQYGDHVVAGQAIAQQSAWGGDTCSQSFPPNTATILVAPPTQASPGAFAASQPPLPQTIVRVGQAIPMLWAVQPQTQAAPSSMFPMSGAYYQPNTAAVPANDGEDLWADIERVRLEGDASTTAADTYNDEPRRITTSDDIFGPGERGIHQQPTDPATVSHFSHAQQHFNSLGPTVSVATQGHHPAHHANPQFASLQIAIGDGTARAGFGTVADKVLTWAPRMEAKPFQPPSAQNGQLLPPLSFSEVSAAGLSTDAKPYVPPQSREVNVTAAHGSSSVEQPQAVARPSHEQPPPKQKQQQGSRKASSHTVNKISLPYEDTAIFTVAVQLQAPLTKYQAWLLGHSNRDLADLMLKLGDIYLSWRSRIDVNRCSGDGCIVVHVTVLGCERDAPQMASDIHRWLSCPCKVRDIRVRANALSDISALCGVQVWDSKATSAGVVTLLFVIGAAASVADFRATTSALSLAEVQDVHTDNG